MKRILKSKVVVAILILLVVCLGIVFAGDAIVKQGVIEGVKFKSTGCTAEGTKAVAFGYETEASGVYSTAMGYQTTASGVVATAMGFLTDANAVLSTAMGRSTTASGDYSTAMGFQTSASGHTSTAMGRGTTASGDYSTAMGFWTDAIRDYSTAMGYGTTASGTYSTSMGASTTASGSYSTAMGWSTDAIGDYSTAMGRSTGAIGDYSTAMGELTNAIGECSTAMGHFATAAANYTTAVGKFCTNDVQDSFAVGFGTSPINLRVDFRVENGKVTVGNPDANTGNLFVGNFVDCNCIIEGSTFYDKDVYGKALDHLEDSSQTIKVNPEDKKEYNHEADPVFLQARVTVKDYDKYTEEEVWDDVLERTITRRIYQTHQELRSSLSMKVAWLRQCVYELKQENQALKSDIAILKQAVGIE